MKFLLMTYADPETWGHPAFLRTRAARALPQAERDRLSERFDELLREITESGELVTGVALADPINTRTVRVRGGAPQLADAPYAGSRVQLAGCFLVDCETPERAYELAARFPDARLAAVEVRPIMSLSALEM